MSIRLLSSVVVGLVLLAGVGCSSGPEFDVISLSWATSQEHVDRTDYTQYGQKAELFAAVALKGMLREDGWRLADVKVSEDFSWTIRETRYRLVPVFRRDPEAKAGMFTGYATFAFDYFYLEHNPTIYCRDKQLGAPQSERRNRLDFDRY